MKTPLMMISQAGATIAVPMVLGEMIARLFTKGAWYDVQAAGFVLSITYGAIATYLLLHSRLLVTRITVGLILSVIAIEGLYLVAMVLSFTGSGSSLLMNLVIYGVMASVPLVMVGLHNLSWSLSQMRDRI